MLHFELNPTRRTSTLDKEIEKIFDVFSKSDYIAPPCEIFDEEKCYTVSMDIPGLRKDELDIEVKDDHLFVTGERKFAKDEKARETVLRSERRYGKFSRVFTLPKNINADAIQARFENGVLDIALPKEEKSLSKKIAISDWSQNNDIEMKN